MKYKFNHNLVDKNLKKLAKSIKYQTLFGLSKNHGFKRFKNEYDLTNIQFDFLNMLSFQCDISLDVACGEVSEKILTDDIYASAYSYYKMQSYKEKKKEVEKENRVQKSTSKNATTFTDTWDFKTKK